MQLSDSWKGAAALAATGEASMIIGGHETNAAQAAAIAAKLRSMEVTVAKTKALVNATALETQHECEAIQRCRSATRKSWCRVGSSSAFRKTSPT